MIFSILIFILTLTILVVIHELGHFLTAKKFNIKVLEFGFGIPPRAFGKKVGETIVSLNWLPIGGFVHLLGEDDVDPKVLNDKRSFASQNVYKRITVVTTGVVMNLLLAWILFTGIMISQNFKTEIPLLYPYQFVGVNQVTEEVILIGEVAKDSPADKAGIKLGNRILAFNGQSVNNAGDFINLTKANAGKNIKLTISDPEKTNIKDVELTPRINPPKGQGALGVALSGVKSAKLEYSSWWQKVFVGPIHSFNIAAYSFDTMAKVFATSFAKKDLSVVSQSVGGPIAIGAVTVEILQRPNAILTYLNLVAALSLSLAIFNILPIPALDGGRFFFLLIEAITKKKINPKLESKIHAIGMVVLLALFVVIAFSDVNNYILRR